MRRDHRWLAACFATLVACTGWIDTAWANDPPPPPPPPSEIPTPRGNVPLARPPARGQVPVPDVRGMSEAQAARTLRAAGLALGRVDRISQAEIARLLGPTRSYAPGLVLQQAPPPSTAAQPQWLTRGSAVLLRVVAGTATRPAPVPTPGPRPVPTPGPRPQPTPGTTYTGPTYPSGSRPPPPPAPPSGFPGTAPPVMPVPGPATGTGPVTVPAPGPSTIPALPSSPNPLLTREPAGGVERPSCEVCPEAGATAAAIPVQYALPCQRERGVWSLQFKGGWTFTAGDDSGDSAYMVGLDFGRTFADCIGVDFYYRFTAQTFDRMVAGGILEDGGGFHHFGLKGTYKSQFSSGSRFFWYGGLGFGWFWSTGYQRNHDSFEGYAELGVGFLLNNRSRIRVGVDVFATPTKAARFDPGQDGGSRLLWMFTPTIGFEYDL